MPDAPAEDILDSAYIRLHATGPEYDGYLSNHGPMVVEAMARRGLGDHTHKWLDGYTRRLDDRPQPGRPVTDEEWREALGDRRRVADWTARFSREIAEEGWHPVLLRWWPRLLPGIAAGATHGVIRTGHAVHALSGQETAARRAELAQALGYWAARWQPVPGAAPFATESVDASAPQPHQPDGRNSASVSSPVTPDAIAALTAVPPVPDRSQDLVHRVSQLPVLSTWPATLASLREPATAAEVEEHLSRLVEAATRYYLHRGHGNSVMLVHAATAPHAVLRTLPALPAEMRVPSFRAAWSATAAVVAAYRPDHSAPPAETETLLSQALSAEEVFHRAVEHGDEHVVKLADTALDVHRRNSDSAALAAALRATQLIPADG